MDLSKYGVKPITQTTPSTGGGLNLSKYGVTPVDSSAVSPEKKPERSFMGEMVKRPLERLVVEPAVRTGEALGRLGVEAFGSEAQKQKAQEYSAKDKTINVPIIGDLTARGLKPTDTGKQLVGEAIESASYLYGPGKVAQSFLARSPFLTKVMTNALYGAVGAGLYGTGEGLQEGEDLTTATKRGLSYAPAGAVAGGFLPPVLEGAIGAGVGGYIGAKTGQGVMKGSAVGGLRGVLGDETFGRLAQRGVSKLETKWDQLFKLTPTQQQFESRTGKNAAKILSNHPEVIPEMNAAGKLDTTKNVEYLRSVVKPEQEAMNAHMAGRTETIPLSKLRSDMKSRIRATGVDKDKAFKQIDNEIDALVRQNRGSMLLGANGETMVPVPVVHNWKQGMWNKIPEDKWIKGLSVEDANKMSVYYRMGDALNDNINKVIDDPDIRSLNGQLGDYYHAIEMLIKRNGSVVEGGRLTGLFSQLGGAGIGTFVGGMVGGPFGAAGGALAGQQGSKMVYNILRDPQFKTFLPRWLAEQAQRGGITVGKEIAEAEARMVATRAGRKALPEASYIPLGPETPKPTQVNITRATPQPMVPERGLPEAGKSSAKMITPAPTTYEKSTPRVSSPQIHTTSIYEQNGVFSAPDIGEVTRKEFIDGLKIAQEAGIPVKYADLPENQALLTNLKKDGSVEFTVSNKFKPELQKTMTEKVKDFLQNPPAGLSTKDVTKSIKNEPQVYKETGDLISEAKKYKSAEEFVKAQSIQKHGLIKPKGQGSGAINGIYGFTDKESAIIMGKASKSDVIVSFKIPKNNFNRVVVDEDIGVGSGIKAFDEGSIAYKGDVPKDWITEISTPDGRVLYKNNVKIGGREVHHYSEFDKTPSQTKSQLTEIWNKANSKVSQVSELLKKEPVYKGEKDITTKVLKKLEGRSTVSKQFISDLTNSPDLKQPERELIRKVLDDYDNEKFYYHGTTPENKKSIMKSGIDTRLNTKGFAEQPEAFYVGDKNEASMYGKDFVGVRQKADAKILKISEKEWSETAGKSRNSKETTEYLKELRKRGYDAIDHGDELEILNSSKFEVFDPDKMDIPVSEFANKVKTELLPLERKEIGSAWKSPHESMVRQSSRYEGITLPEDIRGNVANYSENIYESPIETSAGNTHFTGDTKKYFGHTRIEDMADNKTRRVIEVQSDLYQKGNLDREMSKVTRPGAVSFGINGERIEVPIKTRDLSRQKSKLLQYNDPTAHFRMVREEIKQASKDGKTKLQFPTGETAMKIEGLSSQSQWRAVENAEEFSEVTGPLLKQEDLKIGREVGQANNDGEMDSWIITDVLGDGKFKAIPKSEIDAESYNPFEWTPKMIKEMDIPQEMIDEDIARIQQSSQNETFDISGNIDTTNPIYKFYEKDLGRYLTNKYNAKVITDKQGVKWYEVDVKKDWAKMPVEAFGIAPLTFGVQQLLGKKQTND